MDFALFKLMSPLLILFSTVVAFYTYLLIKVPNRYIFKWVGIPLLLLGSYFSYIEYGKSLGYPLPIVPEGRFVYLAHHTTGNDIIELWVLQANGRSRLFLIPRTALLEGYLEDARGRNAKGIIQFGQLKRRSNGNGEWDWDESTFDSVPIEQMYPKKP